MHAVINLSASQALVEAALAGDSGAREQLRALYRRRVYVSAHRRLSQARAAERATERTFAYAFEHLAEYDRRRGSFDRWLRDIAARECRVEQRAHWYNQIVPAAAILAVLLIAYAVSARPGRGAAAGSLAPAATPVAEAPVEGALAAERSTPQAPAATPVPTVAPSTSGRETVLLMGIDLRAGEHTPANSDTMMLLTLDPATGQASVLSIPRDLYVNIPGYGPNRINTAFFLGQLYNEPGGGPGLAMRTIESNFGVHVDHWAVFKFTAFQQGIDLIGGIDVNVPYAIYDPAYPTDNYGTEVFQLAPGTQHLDGSTALKYVRTRHADNDLQRNARQRQVLLAIKEKVGSPAALAWLAPKLPGFIAGLHDSVQSDLNVESMLQLAWAAAKVDTGNIQQLAIGADAVSDWTTPAGAQVLLPNEARVAAIVREFVDGTCASCAGASAQQPQADTSHTASPRPLPTETLRLLASEHARVEVLNGTQQPGLAQRVAARLRAAGIDVVSVADAVRRDYPVTYIFDYGRAPATVRALADLLQVSDSNEFFVGSGTGRVDVQVIVGGDYAAAAP